MILSGSAVHVNGLGSWFVSATKRLMVAWRSTTHRKTPRFSRRLASLAKNPSTALSQRTRGRCEVEGKARVPVQPLTHLWMLVGSVVVEDHVHTFFGRHLRVNGVQEADELLMTMALHTSANDLAFEDIESSEQRRCAMALVAWVIVPARPFFIGRPGWVRSSAWICDFSSTERTMAWAGGST